VTELTQAKLKELFDYDPLVGDLVRKTTVASNAKVGDIAGKAMPRGYIQVRIETKSYLAHRLIFLLMTGRWPKHEIDHIDHDTGNNRWGNLREATRGENSKNQSSNSRNTSGHIGVCWDKNRKKWEAKINVKRRNVHIGRFEKFEDACNARKAAEKKYGFHPNHGAKAA